ncbi:hypothetical protein V5799_026948 [Amblyomma americanum]|uniref:Uncharacterized protein n=1 Tax=Amblyomma americanum TaxID=6943 RepID=A0AAQ4DH37_AMBAM
MHEDNPEAHLAAPVSNAFSKIPWVSMAGAQCLGIYRDSLKAPRHLPALLLMDPTPQGLQVQEGQTFRQSVDPEVLATRAYAFAPGPLHPRPHCHGTALTPGLSSLIHLSTAALARRFRVALQSPATVQPTSGARLRDRKKRCRAMALTTAPSCSIDLSVALMHHLSDVEILERNLPNEDLLGGTPAEPGLV